MADYKNCTCIACRNEFEPDDDIVVCPECGTPYHRDCWNAHGHCINTALHESGESWTRPESAAEQQVHTEEVVCPNCGSKNEPGGLFCTQCGCSMRDRSESDGAFGGFSGMYRDDDAADWRQRLGVLPEERPRDNPDMDLGGVTLRDAADFIGKNVMYHLPRFKYFHEQKRKLAPNFVCVLFPELYFAYRKMWLPMILCILVTFLLSIPGVLISMAYQAEAVASMLYMQTSGALGEAYNIVADRFSTLAESINAHYDALYWADSICSYVTLVMHILLFLFANFLYYRHAVKKIQKVRADERSLMDVQSRIRIAGGAHFGYVLLAILAEFVLTAAFTYILMFL
ncbi:MAG: DUF2628 domain-containing protein [Ruminococcus sp.]|nr:DUF2628 domain-containing protein [Ruminococcus sp.]